MCLNEIGARAKPQGDVVAVANAADRDQGGFSDRFPDIGYSRQVGANEHNPVQIEVSCDLKGEGQRLAGHSAVEFHEKRSPAPVSRLQAVALRAQIAQELSDLCAVSVATGARRAQIGAKVIGNGLNLAQGGKIVVDHIPIQAKPGAAEIDPDAQVRRPLRDRDSMVGEKCSDFDMPENFQFERSKPFAGAVDSGGDAQRAGKEHAHRHQALFPLPRSVQGVTPVSGGNPA
ncbi:MAG TPA: hypothetical protein VMU18_07210 [Rhodoblastus sp.]|nr:hypothetical protein [Rhodoblastus sp.]